MEDEQPNQQVGDPGGGETTVEDEKTKTFTTVVKSSLPSVIGLTDDALKTFNIMVEEHVRVTSLRMRRASLVLLYSLTKMAEVGSRIPDLHQANSTFWKNLLEMNDSRLPEGLQFLSEVNQALGPAPTVDKDKSISGRADDQILGYAAITFSTVVCNNAWVPLLPRLIRLTKCLVRSKGRSTNIKPSDVVQAIRAKNPAEAVSRLPQWATDHVMEVRRRLEIVPGQFLYDKYGKTLPFDKMFMFNFWMLQRLTELKAKRISLSPVCKVGRAHIRLDRKVLVQFVRNCCQSHSAVVEMLALEASQDGATSHPDSLLPPAPIPHEQQVKLTIKEVDPIKVSVKKSRKKTADVKPDDNLVMVKLKVVKKDRPLKDYLDVKIAVCQPKVSLIITEKKVRKGSNQPPQCRVKINVTEEEDAEGYVVRFRLTARYPDIVLKDMEDRKAEKEKWEAEVEALKLKPAYQAQMARYTLRVAAETKAILSIFKNKCRKNNGWSFDGSIVTDGVAVSQQFSREMKVGKKKSAEELKANAQKRKAADDLMDPDYDRNLSTVLRDKDNKVVSVVLGVDPGRTNIVEIGYIIDKETAELFPGTPRAKSWSLSRGEFYKSSDIWKLNQRQRVRYQYLEAKFEGLTKGSVRTCKSQEVMEYMKQYSLISEDWWHLALKRRESRDALLRYSGKRRALDAFFAKVRKSVKSLFHGPQGVEIPQGRVPPKRIPHLNIQVGYGHAVHTMKPTGKGEVAVPTTGAFKACKRVFGPQNVASTCEFRTTAVGWESGKRKEAVYRIVEEKIVEVDKNGIEKVRYKCKVGHTSDDKMPIVPEEKRALVEEYLEVMKVKRGGRRRGGVAKGYGGPPRPMQEHGGGEEVVERKQACLRYPEVRGLRFCPELRKYFDRDQKSAEAIARLRTTELQGKARPTPFHRSFKFTNDTTGCNI
jgi:hypothetical protein